VDVKESTVKKSGGIFFSKEFRAGGRLRAGTGDKNKASLSDFRPGQRVDIIYKNASGVLVAERMGAGKRCTSWEQSMALM